MNRDRQKKEWILQCLMSLNGGLLGAYAILGHGMFASAETANMLELILALLGHNLREVLIRLAGLLLFVAGMLLCNYLSKDPRINSRRYALSAEALGIFVLCLIPATVDPFVSVLPVFFISATQWTAFHGDSRYNSSTIFSSNNLKQAALATQNYLLDKDPEQLQKAGFFWGTLLWFHLGVACAYFLCHAFGKLSALFCIIPMGISFVLCKAESRAPVSPADLPRVPDLKEPIPEKIDEELHRDRRI